MAIPALGLSQVARKRMVDSIVAIQASSRSSFALDRSTCLALDVVMIASVYLDESITPSGFWSGLQNRG
jgi:hypothetical protein